MEEEEEAAAGRAFSAGLLIGALLSPLPLSLGMGVKSMALPLGVKVLGDELAELSWAEVWMGTG